MTCSKPWTVASGVVGCRLDQLPPGDQEIHLSVPQFPHLQNAVVLVIKLHHHGKALDTVPGTWQESKKAHLLSFCAKIKVRMRSTNLHGLGFWYKMRGGNCPV